MYAPCSRGVVGSAKEGIQGVTMYSVPPRAQAAVGSAKEGIHGATMYSVPPCQQAVVGSATGEAMWEYGTFN